MKTRNSFVSNSSSASFICYWRYLNENDMEVKDLLKKLFDTYGGLDSEGMIEEIFNHTHNTNVPGTFKTDMFTSMYNDLTDIPVSMAYLITGLKVNSDEGFELIDFHMKDD